MTLDIFPCSTHRQRGLWPSAVKSWPTTGGGRGGKCENYTKRCKLRIKSSVIDEIEALWRKPRRGASLPICIDTRVLWRMREREREWGFSHGSYPECIFQARVSAQCASSLRCAVRESTTMYTRTTSYKRASLSISFAQHVLFKWPSCVSVDPTTKCTSILSPPPPTLHGVY